MIHVVQGHEKGIGLEVFLKSTVLLSQKNLNHIILYCIPETLEENLNNLKLPFKIYDSKFILCNKEIKSCFCKNEALPQSTVVLNEALKKIGEGECLLTLPTSKDQLIIKNRSLAGYTEFFRTLFKNSHVAMLFKGPRDLSLLLTDHIPLSAVSKELSHEFIKLKLKVVVDGLSRFFKKPEKIIFAGINPHAGEGGILGREDEEITKAISLLKADFPNINFLGPLPGDTLHFEDTSPSKTLQVYTYHDQGLVRFKSDNGLFGLNISLGLPFLRLSVDHGTAFSIYGKNKADASGCLYALKEALKVLDHDNK